MDKVVDTIDGRSFPRTEDVCCPLCGKHYKPRSIKVYFGMNAWVAECRACRIAFQTPRPSPEATLAYMNWRWSSSDEYVADREAQRERAEKQIGHVCQFVNEPIRLLDFGAGAGSFVRAAQDRGWTVTGVERSDTAIRRAQEYYGVQLVREVGAERFDVITMWDVIEHLRDPEGVLSDFRKCLVPGGLIFLETGNYENWLRIHQGDDWGLYLFDHQTYFSPSSLE